MNLLLAILVLFGAQDLPGAKPRRQIPAVKVLSIRPERGEIKPGETLKVAFDLEIPETWHIYPAGKKPIFGLPTVFKFDQWDVAGMIDEPRLKSVTEPGVGEIEYHEGKITLTVPVTLKGGVPAGPLTASGSIKYQICDPKICHENTTAFSFPIRVDQGSTASSHQDSPAVKILSASASKAEVAPGDVFVISVEAQIPEGWHIYPTTPTESGIPTSFDFGGLETAGKIIEPKPSVHPAQDGEPAYEFHVGKVRFEIPVRVKPGTPPGAQSVKGRMRYQLCDPKICLPPAETALTVQLSVAPGAATSAGAQNAAAQAATRELEKEGLWGFFLLAMGGGLLSLIMPCVYPLIPITITYFVKQGAGSRARSLLLSAAYALGIILVFTVVGFLFSLFLGAAGARKFAADARVNIGVALLFFWFTFSLFGLYEITLPSWLTGSLTGKQRSGIGGAFILGGLFSVVTFTCTIPIAATILAVAASSAGEHRFIGLLAMLVYSTTMAVPFFILGLFPGMMTGVRKSGGDWLHTVKVTAGFAELALALFYLAKADQVSGWGVLTRPVMISVWVAVLVVMSFYLLRVFQLKGDEPDPEPSSGEGATARRQVGIARMLIALFFAVNAVFVGSGFSGRTLGVWDIVLPVNTEPALFAGGGSALTSREPFYDNLPDALAEARKVGKPVFVEFTGVT